MKYPSRHPLYRCWKGMFSRCYDIKDKGYKFYGAKGVSVCIRWFTFDNFVADMGNRPEGISLDRIDAFGNYEPTNCRWANKLIQANNKRVIKTGPRLPVFTGVETTTATTQPGYSYKARLSLRERWLQEHPFTTDELRKALLEIKDKKPVVNQENLC